MIAEAPRKTFGPAHHLSGKVAPLYQEDWWMLDAGRFVPFGLTLVQAYCYLTEFADRAISDEKLALLQASLDNLRHRGLKAVLRFAYERDMGLKEGPTVDWILRHMEQLEPLSRRHVDVIYVLQAGFIGAWGEWHSAARIGFHNDGFLAGPSDGGTWPEPPHFGGPGNPEFYSMTRESAFVPVDGALFWSDQGFDGKAARGKGVDGPECGGEDAPASLQQLQPRAQLLGAGRPTLLD